MKHKKLFSSGTFLALLFAFFPTPAKAFKFEIIPTSMYDTFSTGEFTWTDITAFALHLIQLLITAAGVIAVILLMIGGFQFIFGSMMEDKESGTNTIKHTLLGFVIILLAWIIVDFVIAFLTGA